MPQGNTVAGQAGPTAADERYQIRILTDGTWTYHGSPIRRLELVKLFASVLRRDEAGDYWLITPAERGRIEVEDAPFVAVEIDASGTGEAQVLTFRTNLDEHVQAGPDHPIHVRFDPGSGEPRPYILVRPGLEARIDRAPFYALVELGTERDIGGEAHIGVWSNGIFFPLGKPDAS
ncbi:MAG TPA: DUF1285 domain-containing protein [Azospirillaceae bacterium]|nr:DUF1285 domain-containing protein [Azospirillaceae bacterium]